MTDERQVWYEWHAESFLTIPITPGNRDELSSSLHSGGGGQSLVHSPLSMPSPLADDESFFWNAKTPARAPHQQLPRRASTVAGLGYEVVKIGHTNLHNPGGRSSWIGL